MRRISAALGFVLLLAAAADAQLASQTALVGTVTDTAGGVMPGAQVVAVNLGTKDTYEATDQRRGLLPHPVRAARHATRSRSRSPGFQTFKTTGVEVATNQVVRTNATLAARRRRRDGERRGAGPRC